MKLWRKPLDAGKVVGPRGQVQVQTAWCKGCQYCVVFCPTKVLELSSGFNAKGYHYPVVKDAEACVDCRLCERLCPEYSIVVTSRVIRPAEASAPVGEPAAPPAAADLRQVAAGG